MTVTMTRRSGCGMATTALIRKKIINHVMIVLDASPSMGRHVQAVRQQLRQLLADLREQSTAMDQETRVTIYAFSSQVEVLAFDTDVLRLPNIHESYSLMRGMTALNDATAIGVDDLLTTSTVYGDHGFLAYVITDGVENDSRRFSAEDVAHRMSALPQNWTVAALVPDPAGRRYVTDRLGIPADNVALWDVNSSTGFADASATISRATTSYMQNRATGMTQTRSLFSTGADAVNTATVTQAVQAGALSPLTPGSFTVKRNDGPDQRMDEFFPNLQVGRGFYEFTKRETIQPQKKIAVQRKATGEVFYDSTYGSPAVRALIGLDANVAVRVSPDFNPEYTIFVQSTAPNRSVRSRTSALLLR